MNIAKIQYTLSKKSLDIYVSGCQGPHCEDCQNPSLWKFDVGLKYDDNYFNKIYQKITDFDELIDNIMIFGGDLIDQDYEDIIEFLSDISALNKKIWIFTGYELDKIDDSIKQLCDYIKCGRYDKTLTTEDNIQYGMKLATSNQNIYKKSKDF